MKLLQTERDNQTVFHLELNKDELTLVGTAALLAICDGNVQKMTLLTLTILVMPPVNRNTFLRECVKEVPHKRMLTELFINARTLITDANDKA